MTAASILPLELQGVSLERDRQRLLKEVSVRIAEGPKTIVLGPNGAGKSLLLRLCHGLIAPSEGAVLWHGAAGRDPLRFQAMVMQRPVMLRRSVAANIDFALGLRRIPRPERRRLVAQALERTGLGAFARVPARVLSFGEQQRLALGALLGAQAPGAFPRRAHRQSRPCGDPRDRGRDRGHGRRREPRSS